MKPSYKNHRKQVNAKNLRQDPAIIPLHSTVEPKDQRLDYNMSFIHLPYTTFHHQEQTTTEETEKEEKDDTTKAVDLNEV